VERIEGSFDNVVGLPLRTTLRLIEKAVEKGMDDDVVDEALVDPEAEADE